MGQDLRGVGRAGHVRDGCRGRVGGEQGAHTLGRGDLRGVRVHPDARGDGAQRAGEVLGAGPLVRVLAQAALYDGPQRVRHGRGAARFGAQVLVEHFEGGPMRRTAGAR